VLCLDWVELSWSVVCCEGVLKKRRDHSGIRNEEMERLESRDSKESGEQRERESVRELKKSKNLREGCGRSMSKWGDRERS